MQCDRHAPATVRRALAELEAADLPEERTLVASELVTNAVLHSGCEEEHILEVRAAVRPGRLLISVHNPNARGGTDSEFRPWGWRVIGRLSQGWGCERPDGYLVWAELAMPA